MMRRAEVAKACVLLAGDVLQDSDSDTRLADARLSRQQDYLAFHAFCTLPAAAQGFDFLRTAHQRGGSFAMQRFKTTVESARSKHLIRADQLGISLDLKSAQIRKIE